MNPALLVKLRPNSPWRIGPASGARDRVDSIYHSDTLYSAITHAMRLLGRLEYWLEVTARSEESAQIRFSSAFPFFGETLYVPPPKHIWPPPPSVRVRYSGARFIPLPLVENIFSAKALEDDRWTVDGETACLVPVNRSGPYRIRIRSSAAVDRLSGAAEPFSTACLEFSPRAGIWFAISFQDEITRDQWRDPLRSAIRLLADSGFGGERSRGWGRAHPPEFREGTLPQLLYKGPAGDEQLLWTLSLVTPSPNDEIDWSRGSYALTTRGGRIDSSSQSGAAKKLLNMVEEGSVLAASRLQGSSPDVAPDQFPHPVYHAGWAFAIPVPAEAPRQVEFVEQSAAPETEEVFVPVEAEESQTLPAEITVAAAEDAAASGGQAPAAADAGAAASEGDSRSAEPSAPTTSEVAAPASALSASASDEDSEEDHDGATAFTDINELIAEEDPTEEIPPHDAPTEAREFPGHFVEDEPEIYRPLEEVIEDIGVTGPVEIPVPDEEIEPLTVDETVNPDDKLTNLMENVGPVEQPIEEPGEMTPTNPDPTPHDPSTEDEPVPGPNPDEPEKQGEPIE
jgi:CRISPR type III-A-associated RAMP protein Csm4